MVGNIMDTATSPDRFLSKQLLNPKMFEGGAFRGNTAESSSLLSLLHDYVLRLLCERQRRSRPYWQFAVRFQV